MKCQIVLRDKVVNRTGNSIIVPKYSGVEEYCLICEMFGLLKLTDYKPFLQAVVTETYFQFFETGSFLFGPVKGSLFDETEDLANNEVEIGIADEVVRKSKIEFFKECSIFGKKILAGADRFQLERLGCINHSWKSEIKNLVETINSKIAKHENVSQIKN